MEAPLITEFRLKKFRVVMKGIYSVLMITIFIFVAIKLPYDNLWIPAFFLIPMTLMFGAFFYVSLGEVTFKLTVTSTHFFYKDIYSEKKIPFEEVKVFQLNSPGVRAEGFMPGFEVEIKSINGITITTPHTTKDHDDLIEWLRKNFTELT